VRKSGPTWHAANNSPAAVTDDRTVFFAVRRERSMKAF
jgi:hypothetical protein